jgi:lactoylglutathione lyase
VEDIEAVGETLKNKGIAFESEAPIYRSEVFPKGTKWLMFRGPDGEHLELNEVM